MFRSITSSLFWLFLALGIGILKPIPAFAITLQLPVQDLKAVFETQLKEDRLLASSPALLRLCRVALPGLSSIQNEVVFPPWVIFHSEESHMKINCENFIKNSRSKFHLERIFFQFKKISFLLLQKLKLKSFETLLKQAEYVEITLDKSEKVPVDHSALDLSQFEEKYPDLLSLRQRISTEDLEIEPLGFMVNFEGIRPVVLARLRGLSYETVTKTRAEWIPFYLSTGQSSGRPDEWLPFYGMASSAESYLWIMKCGGHYSIERFRYIFGSGYSVPSQDLQQWQNDIWGKLDLRSKSRLENIVLLLISAELNRHVLFNQDLLSLTKGIEKTFPLQMISKKELNARIGANNGFGIDLGTLIPPEKARSLRSARYKRALRARRGVKKDMANPQKNLPDDVMLLFDDLEEVLEVPTVEEIQSACFLEN